MDYSFKKVFIEFLQHYFCCLHFWFFGPEACGILASWPVIKLTTPALKGEVLTRTSREVPNNYYYHYVAKGNKIPTCPKPQLCNAFQFSSVQLLSHVWLFATPWIAVRRASLSITISRSSLKLTSIESVMPSSHLILCRPLLLLPAMPPIIRVFSNESTLCMRWPKYWSFSFGIIPSKEHPGLISCRMDWLDLLAVQGTLKSLLQHHNSKPSIFRYSAFFTVQLWHPYMTTGKTILAY